MVHGCSMLYPVRIFEVWKNQTASCDCFSASFFYAKSGYCSSVLNYIIADILCCDSARRAQSSFRRMDNVSHCFPEYVQNDASNVN